MIEPVHRSLLAWCVVALGALALSGCIPAGHEPEPEPECEYSLADLNEFADRLQAIEGAVAASQTRDEARRPFLEAAAYLKAHEAKVKTCYRAEFRRGRSWDGLWDASWMMDAGAQAATDPADVPPEREKEFLLITVRHARERLRQFDASQLR